MIQACDITRLYTSLGNTQGFWWHVRHKLLSLNLRTGLAVCKNIPINLFKCVLCCLTLCSSLRINWWGRTCWLSHKVLHRLHWNISRTNQPRNLNSGWAGRNIMRKWRIEILTPSSIWAYGWQSLFFQTPANLVTLINLIFKWSRGSREMAQVLRACIVVAEDLSSILVTCISGLELSITPASGGSASCF